VPGEGREPPCGYPRWILSSFQGWYTRPTLSQTVRTFNESQRSSFLGEDEFSHLWSTRETKFSPSRVFGATYNPVHDIADTKCSALRRCYRTTGDVSVITREGMIGG